MNQLLSAIAADWQALQELKSRIQGRIAAARGRGVPGRTIARVTRIPETSVRRWASEGLAGEPHEARKELT